jgi:hypothetical protein
MFLEHRRADARLDALMDGAVEVGDVAIAERAVLSTAARRGCWRDSPPVPSVSRAFAARADFIGGSDLRLIWKKGMVGKVD